MSQTIPKADLEQLAWFAAAEAKAQGYQLPDEEGAFLRHIEGTGRQWFMREGLHPVLQFRALPGSDGALARVCVVVCHRGTEALVGQWDITDP